MKSDKIIDAMNEIDENLIERAEKDVKKSTKKSVFIKWTSAIAACLVIAFMIHLIPNVLNPSTNPFDTTTSQNGGDDGTTHGITISNPQKFLEYSICNAEYPQRAQYPIDLTLYTDEWSAMIEVWKNDQKEYRKYKGAGENLEEFFTKSISQLLSESNGENLLYSPINLYMALAMLAEITDGETRQEILDLLCASDIDALRNQANSIWKANYMNDGAHTCILASSVWLNEIVDFNLETLKSLSDNYYTSSFTGKMGSDEFTEALISWINAQTGGLLSDKLSGFYLDGQTIMALVTTIYFRAKWTLEDTFYEKNTKEDTFHGAKNDTVCDFMNSTSHSYYYWGKNFSATTLSLEGSGYMTFILPDKGVSINKLLKDNEALEFMISNEDWENEKHVLLNLSLPKFDVSSKTELSEHLKALGIDKAFSSDADFSPLFDEGGSISRIEHSVRVAIDEEGVTAAAYTLGVNFGGAFPTDEVDMKFDRPFIFIIKGVDGLPLFVGAVNEV